MSLKASSGCQRHNNPAFRKASKALAEGKLPMPVLMLYADSDTALGTQLVKVSTCQLWRHHYMYCSNRQTTSRLMLLAATCSACLLYMKKVQNLCLTVVRAACSGDGQVCEGSGAACAGELLALGAAGQA